MVNVGDVCSGLQVASCKLQEMRGPGYYLGGGAGAEVEAGAGC